MTSDRLERRTVRGDGRRQRLPVGSQTNDGDLQQHAPTSVPSSARRSGRCRVGRCRSFATSGNHGLTSTTSTRSTEQMDWPETTAAATSGGSYIRETYCCVNGTASASYPSSWYAFDAGGARFYVLQADWADGNPGSGTVYSDDYAAHWTPSSPEYRWLQADLAAHPSGLKFAFWHYPMYSDQKAQNSDTYLQGPSSLQGLLASNGVNHRLHRPRAHLRAQRRQRPGHVPHLRRPAAVAARCSPSPRPVQRIRRLRHRVVADQEQGLEVRRRAGSRLRGTRVPLPRRSPSPARIVTVAPTDELGRTFDVQTYDFSGPTPPDTVFDTTPPTPTNATSASRSTFHSTIAGGDVPVHVSTAAPRPPAPARSRSPAWATGTHSADGHRHAPTASPTRRRRWRPGRSTRPRPRPPGGLSDSPRQRRA